MTRLEDVRDANPDSGLSTLELDEPMSGGPWSLELSGPGPRRVVRLTSGQTLTIGTAPSCQLVVEDPTVSGRHVSVVALASGVIVEDLGSKNGVYVGGARVGKASLRGGQGCFMIGRTIITVRPAIDRQPAAPSPLIPGLIGSSESMRRLVEEIRRVAVLDAPVQIGRAHV